MSTKDKINRLKLKIAEHPVAGPFFEKHSSIIKTAGIIIIVVIIGGVIMTSDNKEEVEIYESSPEAASQTETMSNIYVDVGGAVKNGGVVILDQGSRVADAISAAGGLTSKADMTSINQAAIVNDGEKIYIPERNENGEADYLSEAINYGNGKVNINLADSEELQTLTGVGPVTAEKIIEYRMSNGRFAKIEDLKNVSGIGEKTFNKLKEQITI